MKYKVETSSKFNSKQNTEGYIEVYLDEHLLTDDAIDSLCRYNRLPKVLFSLQERISTDFLNPILRNLPEVKAVISENDNTVLDIVHPNKEFISDERLYELDTILKDINSTSNDFVFNSDIFSYKSAIKRPLSGGLILEQQLLRLVCSNGLVVPASDFRVKFSTDPSDSDFKSSYNRLKGSTSFQSYFHNVFGDDLNPRIATLFDLNKFISSSPLVENINDYYPFESISQHYQLQGLSIDKLPQVSLRNLSSGLTYYQCFNILTNLYSNIVPATTPEQQLKNDITISNFLSPASVRDFEFSRIAHTLCTSPVIESKFVEHAMGDVCLV